MMLSENIKLTKKNTETISLSEKSLPLLPIIFYCVLAYLLFWVPFFAMSFSKSETAVSMWTGIFGILGLYAPLLAALITRIVTRDGFADARLTIRSVKKKWWALALLLPFFWAGFQDACLIIFDFVDIDSTKLSDGIYRVPINLLGGFLVFIGEEFGWRSYLQEKTRLLGRFRSLTITSVIWSIWHAPMVIIPNTVYGNKIDLMGTILALIIFALFGYIFGWLYLESKSVWTVVLMHSYNNKVGIGLFTEALIVKREPSLMQSVLMAIVPVMIVWSILFFRGEFSKENDEIKKE